MPDLPLVGDEFAGYRLRAVLGRGGMSVVYQAENPRLGNIIALKVLAPELASDDIFRTRFLEESRIAASMNHPHVIPIHDMGSGNGLLYIAMRCVMGTDLRQMIKKRGRLQPDTSVFLLAQAARALDAAHRRGLVHRDVKPGNLLVERGNDDGDPDHLYLADFGITKPAMSRTGLTSTGQFIGTIDYVAPEQIRGISVLGMADQYSLGCVLYECLTGRVPFEKDMDAAIIWAHVEEPPTRPTLLRPDLPPAVDGVFARVLAKNPGDRYENCREFMEAARVALGDMATAPPAGGSLRTLQPVPTPAGYPGELTHEAAEPPPPGPATESMVVPAQQSLPAGPSQDRGTLTSHRRQADAPPPGGADRADGWQPPGGREPRRGLPRARWLVAAAALALIAAGADAWAALGRGPAAHPGAAATSPAAKATATHQQHASALMQALTLANESGTAAGKLPPASCRQQSATMATCAAPAPGIDQVAFQTYPSLTALYSAYETEVKSLNSGHFQANVQDCGLRAPSPFGEVAWNHQFQHPKTYSVQQMEMGTVTADKAAGRMFCVLLNTGSEDIVWTQDNGNMLGVVSGAPHEDVWDWWVAVHHNIAFSGMPMQMPMPSAGSSGSAIPSAGSSGSAKPSAAASAMPS